MEKYEVNKYIDKFSSTIEDLKISLNPSALEEEINNLSAKMNEDGFWDDQKASSKVIANLNNLKEKLKYYIDAKKGFDEVIEAKEMDELENSLESNQFLEDLIFDFDKLLDDITIKVILSGQYDDSDAILEIHPGAGGTESMDWASMLFRMYQRYAQRHNFKFKIIDYLDGEEAGIKSVTVLISGKNAYGLLKGERGVHRLVRISPFDANKRRHTSFASVDVSPVREDVKDVVVNDQDIRIDTYLSSGHGGQGVNTTYSAVRITHYPSGIVVTCQNERSQLQNKEQAMNILKSKLLEIEIKKQEEELMNLKGSNSQIAFGSQIRSYVFHPYSMVKDHRFDVETGNATAVMDGDIDAFIYGYLKWMVSQNA